MSHESLSGHCIKSLQSFAAPFFVYSPRCTLCSSMYVIGIIFDIQSLTFNFRMRPVKMNHRTGLSIFVKHLSDSSSSSNSSTFFFPPSPRYNTAQHSPTTPTHNNHSQPYTHSVISHIWAHSLLSPTPMRRHCRWQVRTLAWCSSSPVHGLGFPSSAFLGLLSFHSLSSSTM